jgi:lysozyme family protein
MATFTREFFNTIGNWEGGYQCMPEDAGNYDSKKRLIGTNRGIAAMTLETYYMRFKGINLAFKSIDEFKVILKALTYEDAFAIAKALFWDAINCDSFANQSLAEIVFDWFWASYAYGIQWMQGCLKTIGINVQVDLALTKNEVALINAYADQKGLFDFIKSERLKYTAWLCKQKPSNEKFHIGWDRRIRSYQFKA